MSSPSEFARQKPYTPFACSHLFAIAFFNRVCASANNVAASLPTTGSSKIAGYFPLSSHVWKNGDQSIKGTILSSGKSASTLGPRKAGTAMDAVFQSQVNLCSQALA